MLEDHFEPLTSEDPISEGVSQVALKGGGCLSSLIGASSLQEFLAFLDEKVVFFAPECCIVSNMDPPDACENYCIEFAVVATGCNESDGVESNIAESNRHALKVCGSNAEACRDVLWSLLQFMSAFEQIELDVSLKAFATQPRQPLPTVTEATLTGKNGAIGCLRFLFCAVDGVTVNAILSAISLREVEFRQCALGSGLGDALLSSAQGGPETLIVSCTMPEFASSAAGLGGGRGIKKLELFLHFWVQGDPFLSFCEALARNTELKELRIKYLDVNDEGWVALFNSLRANKSVESLSLSFTDNFVDDYRRLTPERRTQRTEAVLQCLRENTTLKALQWPNFQRDEDLFAEVEGILAKRNN